jgi:pyruvate ferredoxin oxidoreductase delta subunit
MGYCPVNSIYAEGEEILISYDYCKGCGICAKECPKQAINMEQEVK